MVAEALAWEQLAAGVSGAVVDVLVLRAGVAEQASVAASVSEKAWAVASALGKVLGHVESRPGVGLEVAARSSDAVAGSCTAVEEVLSHDVHRPHYHTVAVAADDAVVGNYAPDIVGSAGAFVVDVAHIEAWAAFAASDGSLEGGSGCLPGTAGCPCMPSHSHCHIVAAESPAAWVASEGGHYRAACWAASPNCCCSSRRH